MGSFTRSLTALYAGSRAACGCGLSSYCLYRRRLLGEIARVAVRTVTAAIRALTGERARAVGIVACLQTHGSRANGHPHLHLLVTDGGFRPAGTFVVWPVQDTARLTEAFRRAVLRLFVRLELFDDEQAAGMRTWPHSGFHVHTAVWVPEEDRAFATRRARYCATPPSVSCTTMPTSTAGLPGSRSGSASAAVNSSGRLAPRGTPPERAASALSTPALPRRQRAVVERRSGLPESLL